MNRQIWHIISPEYPPQMGGVGDYVYLLANELAETGDEVQVWCAGPDVPAGGHPGVKVRPLLGRLNPGDLLRVGRELNGFSKPRFILLQWVPHAYGWRSMNVAFCVWIWIRARWAGDDLGIMVHEPFLSFWEGSWRQNAAALVHRLMTVLLLNAAQRAWVSTPRWEKAWKPYALGRRVPFSWLPLPSNVPVSGETAAVEELRARYAPAGERIVGHFGTFGYPITPMLEWIVPRLLGTGNNSVMLFIGPKGLECKEKIVRAAPELATRIHATGAISARDARLSALLAACDLMIQPYPDGVSSRRTSLLAPLAHGVPIVTTYGPSTEPLWRETEAVAMVAPEDLEGFVGQARRLLADQAARQRAAQAARMVHQRYFVIQRIAEVLRSAYPHSQQASPAEEPV
ncbi:MAG TPA: glycosyltransferase [Bryobacteraceae bacterium]|nr:glycosyltransferase [Bryobacteraceae bacterium]